MIFDALLANLRYASTNWWKVNKNLINFLWPFIVIVMYIILLNEPRFDQISCSGRSGTRWHTGCPKPRRVFMHSCQRNPIKTAYVLGTVVLYCNAFTSMSNYLKAYLVW